MTSCQPFDGFFVPGNPGAARPFQVGRAILDLERLGQDRVPPVGVLEPVCRGREAEKLALSSDQRWLDKGIPRV